MTLLDYARRKVAALDLATASQLDGIAEKIYRKLDIMADQITETLNAVADQAPALAEAVTALVAERNAFATRNAELEGTEVVQSAAAGRVQSAFNGIADALRNDPQAPDVEPLPEVPTPAEPATDPSPAGEGSTDTDGTPVVDGAEGSTTA